MENDKCRLCYGNIKFKFNEIVLKKNKVNYFYCLYCNSLQTEKVYWLDDAYKSWNTIYDTGLVARVYNNFLVSFFISKLFKLKNILDYGGGDGLFTRIMRDYNLNCYNYDSYAESIYSKKFINPDFEYPDLVTSFEAIEHFSDPKKEFENIFKKKPKIIILTTKIYKNQDKNWDYFEFQTGQHIFFYSKQAFRYLAEKFNYNLVFLELGYILFYSQEYRTRKLSFFMLRNFFIRKKFLIFLNFFKIFFKNNGYEKDYKLLKKE